MQTIKHDWKLESIPNGFCHVQHDGVSIKLISYETCVCWIERFTSITDGEDAGVLYCSGNYSRSTIKHIARFTSEFVGVSKYAELRELLIRASKCYSDKARLADREAATMYDVGAVYIKLTAKELDAFDRRLAWYKEKGKRFTKYSKQPNYEMLYYGISSFNPINL